MADEGGSSSSTPSSGKRRGKRPLSGSPLISPVRNPVRTGSPISVGSLRYRPLSPVYDPDAKVYPPYAMILPQIFVPAMDEKLLWGSPIPDEKSVSGEEGRSDAMMDWESELREAIVTQTGVYSFDPRETGSFPPRPEEMLLFPARRRRRVKLEELDVEEDQMRQPETDVQPAEGSRDEVRAIEAGKGRPTKFVLPLELFDNPDMDLVHPSLLIQVAHERGEPGVKARTRRYTNDGTPSWSNCEVVHYDKSTDNYTIEWLSPNGDRTGKTKTVRRLNLLFDTESEGNFIARLLAARDLRQRVESQTRYWKFVKALPFVNPEGVDGQLTIRLMEAVGRNLSLKYPKVFKILLDELKEDYHSSVNKAILEFRLRVADEEQRAHFNGLQIFPGPEHSPLPAGKYACVHVPYHPDAPFISKLEEISTDLVIAEEAFLLVLLQFHKDMDIRSTVLVNPEIFTAPRPWGVDDFRLKQDSYTRDVADSFRNIWTDRILGLIDKVLPTGELLNDPWGKLPRLVSRLSLMMSGQLQHVVLESVNIFKHIWLDYFSPRASKDGDLQPLPIGIRKDPLFKIRLLLQGDHFEFYPKLEFVETTVRSLLEGIVEAVKGMDDLQTRLNDVFRSYASKEMVVVDLDNKQVTAAWDVIQDILLQSFVQPNSLFERFISFNYLAAMDVPTQIENWKAGHHTLQEYEMEIGNYLEVADSALKNSEKECYFELFVINCETICNDLSAKSKSIADRLLTQIMEATTTKNGDTRKQYENIETTLLGSIDNPEQLAKLREYVAESKERLYKLKLEVDETKKVWEMLQRKSFHVPDYHSQLYWITVGWPQRVTTALHGTETRLAQQRVVNNIALPKTIHAFLLA